MYVLKSDFASKQKYVYASLAFNPKILLVGINLNPIVGKWYVISKEDYLFFEKFVE